MKYGAHLPLIDLGERPSLPALRTYTHAAAELGYRYLCANDHLPFDRPWLDGPTALAAMIHDSGDMRLATTVSLPALRVRRSRPRRSWRSRCCPGGVS